MKSDWKTDFVYHWKHFVHPARPGYSELELIKSKIKERKQAKVLILGSTPEYRDLCGKLGADVTLIDFNKKNYQYLAKEMKTKPKEKFVNDNWITTVLNEKFDIILGDVVLNIVNKDNIIKVISNIFKMLKSGGLFLPRTYVRSQEERHTPEGIIKKYRKNGSKKPMFSWTVRDIMLSAYNFEDENLVFKDIWTNMNLLFKKGLITKEELENYRKLSFEKREFNFYFPEKKEFDKLLSNFFKLNGIFHSKKEYAKDNFPIHILTKE